MRVGVIVVELPIIVNLFATFFLVIPSTYYCRSWTTTTAWLQSRTSFRRGPGECESCGAEKINEVSDKLKDYKLQLEDLEEEEAKEAIRTDLMAFL